MTTSAAKPPVWFFIVSGLALIWNLMGVFAYIQQMTISPEALAALSDAERSLYENYPAWAAAAFAFAVFGGALGCVLMLLGKKIATPVFWGSLIGIAVQMIHSFFIAETMAVYGPGAIIMPTMVVVIGLALLWLSIIAKARGWLS